VSPLTRPPLPNLAATTASPVHCHLAHASSPTTDRSSPRLDRHPDRRLPSPLGRCLSPRPTDPQHHRPPPIPTRSPLARARPAPVAAALGHSSGRPPMPPGSLHQLSSLAQLLGARTVLTPVGPHHRPRMLLPVKNHFCLGEYKRKITMCTT
jgi:hypothetical protein